MEPYNFIVLSDQENEGVNVLNIDVLEVFGFDDGPNNSSYE